MSKFNFKVSAPSLLGATFSVMTSEDGEPIIANVDEQGKWAFTVPSDMDAELLSNIQDICEGQFVPSVLAHIRADRFFKDALDEAKDVPAPDEFEKARQVVMDDVLETLLREVDEADLRLFKDYFTEMEHTFESMSRVLSKLVLYKELKK